jgi:cysteine synthase A
MLQEVIMIYNDISELVGSTPLLSVSRYSKAFANGAKILCKLEYLNPAGSAKDRIALAMIEDAESKGLISKEKNSVIIEPTSGNTGIGLAAVCASRGYELILTMPSSMSIERRKLLAAYGAKIVLTDGTLGMKGAIDEAKRIAASLDSAFIPSQFSNPANPKAHYLTTAPEIWEDTDGNVDIFVAGIGTGGTLSGVAKYLKERNPNVIIVGVEPASSPLITKGMAGAHGIQGIGANFIPENLDRECYDEIFPVTEEEAYAAARKLAHLEGILVGITSGAALHAATELAKRPENANKNIVVILPDTGDRYLSTPLFD